jgi:hypothetical protein
MRQVMVLDSSEGDPDEARANAAQSRSPAFGVGMQRVETARRIRTITLQDSALLGGAARAPAGFIVMFAAKSGVDSGRDEQRSHFPASETTRRRKRLIGG